MAKLRVKNFGPIKEGFSENDGFMPIQKLTLFIGAQGSGKSTIAKIYSSFVWLEKAYFCGFDITKNFVTKDFIQLCSNQLLPEVYFTEKTELDYIGDYCSFSFHQENFECKIQNSNEYLRPKIMYMPSERNLVSVLDNVEKIQNLPPMLKLLQKEISKAKKNYIPKLSENYSTLSLDGYSIKYDSKNDTLIIIERKSNVAVPLTNASSGLQSVVPLLTVTDFLGLETTAPILDKLKSLSSDEQDVILSAIFDKNLSKNLKLFFETGLGRNNITSGIEKYTSSYSRYINSYFINIVEEPEQNLFPTYQKEILESLIIHANLHEKNQLMITTHSPYILGSLNNCIYAGNLTKLGKDCSSVKSLDEQISFEDVMAYKIENGRIYSIMSDELQLINNSEIDSCSDMINAEYQKLEDIELS